MEEKKIHIHILNATGIFDNYIDKITKNSEEAIWNVVSKIPISKIDILIYNNKYKVIKEIGIGGYTGYIGNKIDISINMSYKDLKTSINNELKRTIAHEMHHAMRMQTIGYGETLLDGIISEGLADHFDEEIYGKRIPGIWTAALSSEDIHLYLKKAKSMFNSTEYNHAEWFFGTDKIPKWTGYSLGYYIIDKYLKLNPTKKPSTIYNKKSKDIIKDLSF